MFLSRTHFVMFWNIYNVQYKLPSFTVECFLLIFLQMICVSLCASLLKTFSPKFGKLSRMIILWNNYMMIEFCQLNQETLVCWLRNNLLILDWTRWLEVCTEDSSNKVCTEIAVLFFNFSRSLVSHDAWLHVVGEQESDCNIRIFMIKNLNTISIFLKEGINLFMTWWYLLLNLLSVVIINMVWCPFHS